MFIAELLGMNEAYVSMTVHETSFSLILVLKKRASEEGSAKLPTCHILLDNSSPTTSIVWGKFLPLLCLLRYQSGIVGVTVWIIKATDSPNLVKETKG